MLKVLLCNLVAFGFGCGAYGLTIPASEDTMGYGNALSKASGASASLSVDGARTSYLYFDLNDIPSDAVVRWAKLRLFIPVVRAQGAGLGVHLVTSEWNEALTSRQPSIDAGTLGVIEPEKLGSKRFVTVDVTSTVQSWISGGTLNEGFAITPIIKTGKATASVMLTSKEGTALGLPAELDIEFKPAAESVVLEQLPLSIQQYFSPTFTTQPFTSIYEGVIRAEATGMGTIAYQWYQNGVAVTGGTGSTLSVVGLASGTYTLSASNGFATVASLAVQFISPPAPSVSLAFAPIPGGTHSIGNVSGDSDITDNPGRSVTLSAYSMAVTDTTKAQWDTVRTWGLTHGYKDLPEGVGRTSNHPVLMVSWYDVVKWANAASEKDGLKLCYTVNGAAYRTGNSDAVTCDWSSNGYRLPTEAEWEVAARGGLTGKRFPWGDTISQSQANYNSWGGISYDVSPTRGLHSQYAGSGYPCTSPAGSFAANGYGLYDMAGNVFQWCWDWYGTTVAEIDPRGVSSSSARVLRGGYWYRTADNARCAFRFQQDPAPATSDAVGFRLARGDGAPAVARQSMLRVLGGTLPSDSGLAGQPVGDFQIGETEVTWGEWKTVREWAVTNGYTDLSGGYGTWDNRAVSWVNWYDVVRWCNAKSEKEGKTPVYQLNGMTYKTGQSAPTVDATANGYRLPSEAEWEWAARGGRQSHGYTYSGSNDANAVAWYIPNWGGTTHEVATKAANELGLYDMSGNVWEWCWDLWSSDTAERRLRGGSGAVDESAVSFRGGYYRPSGGDYSACGFRLACSSGQ